MPKAIQIRGTIIGPLPKNSWARDYVEAGLVTPLNDVVDAVKASNEDIVLEINSGGGSVFAGNEMLNAIVDWQKTSGKKADIKIGALAGSQAASIVLQASGKKSAHKNTKLMFHSAAAYSEGGPEAMNDMADLLSKINADTTKRLDALGIPKEVYSEWMAEGRMGWVTAEQAKQHGIIDEIIGEEATFGKLPKSFVKAATAALPGFSIVALGLEEEPEQPEQNGQPETNETTESPAPVVPKSEGETVVSEPVADKIVAEFKETVANLSAQIASLTGENKQLKDEAATAKTSLDDLQAKLDKATADGDKLKQDLATEVTAHAATSAAHSALKEVHARACPSGQVTETASADLGEKPTGTLADKEKWSQLVAKHGYAQAFRLNPELAKSLVK